ncbi:hypothetical protein [Vibrio rarus]|uniref:hypothetical protein n=1 Tax=Vibrio rarus TaxID=413403 RepID=UPI0021C3607C|nr:hypothetical protein [Vibrio rarus]
MKKYVLASLAAAFWGCSTLTNAADNLQRSDNNEIASSGTISKSATSSQMDDWSDKSAYIISAGSIDIAVHHVDDAVHIDRGYNLSLERRFNSTASLIGDISSSNYRSGNCYWNKCDKSSHHLTQGGLMLKLGVDMYLGHKVIIHPYAAAGMDVQPYATMKAAIGTDVIVTHSILIGARYDILRPSNVHVSETRFNVGYLF